MTSNVSVNQAPFVPTDNVTDNQCYGSVIVGSSVQHHVTVSSNPCYETVTYKSTVEPVYMNNM